MVDRQWVVHDQIEMSPYTMGQYGSMEAWPQTYSKDMGSSLGETFHMAHKSLMTMEGKQRVEPWIYYKCTQPSNYVIRSKKPSTTSLSDDDSVGNSSG